jgi:hypothetical protein
MGITLSGGATREAPVRTEPHPTRSFALPSAGAPCSTAIRMTEAKQIQGFNPDDYAYRPGSKWLRGGQPLPLFPTRSLAAPIQFSLQNKASRGKLMRAMEFAFYPTKGQTASAWG